MLALVEGEAPGIAEGRGKATSGVGLPVIGIEQEPALPSNGADPPSWPKPLAGLLLPIVDPASCRAAASAVGRQERRGVGVASTKLSHDLRGSSPVRIDDE